MDDKKIVLFLDKKKKCYIIYSTLADLMDLQEPFDCTTLPLQRVNDIDEQWIIKKVTYLKGSISLEFEKIK